MTKLHYVMDCRQLFCVESLSFPFMTKCYLKVEVTTDNAQLIYEFERRSEVYCLVAVSPGTEI